MLDGGLDQEPDQVAVLQGGAAGDDRPGDLDLVQRQDIDQRPGRPARARQLLREAVADLALGLHDQGHEDVVEQSLDRVGVQGADARSAVAQVRDGQKQSFAVPGAAGLRELHQPLGLTGDIQKALSGFAPNIGS